MFQCLSLHFAAQELWRPGGIPFEDTQFPPRRTEVKYADGVTRMGAESKLSAEAAARFVLGLSQGCSKEDVKRAFRRLALVFHPDKNKGQNEEEATKRFQAIATAKDGRGPIAEDQQCCRSFELMAFMGNGDISKRAPRTDAVVDRRRQHRQRNLFMWRFGCVGLVRCGILEVLQGPAGTPTSLVLAPPPRRCASAGIVSERTN
eukprot:s1605_g11.t1